MTVTVNDVLGLRDSLVARGRTGAEVLMGLRAELYALLELESPLPTKSTVTVDHLVEAENARDADPHFTSAHHYVQKKHATALWHRVDELVEEAGVR